MASLREKIFVSHISDKVLYPASTKISNKKATQLKNRKRHTTKEGRWLANRGIERSSHH